MLIEFSVENFYCIKEKITLSFKAPGKKDELDEYYVIQPKKGLKILKLALIFGANASGKTTILKALNFLRKINIKSFNDKSVEFGFKPFIFDNKEKSTKFDLEFFINEKHYFYSVTLNKKAILEESLFFSIKRKTKIFERKTDIKKQVTTINFGEKIKLKKSSREMLISNTLSNDTVLAAFNKTNLESQLLKDAFDWFYHVLKPIIYSGTDLTDFIVNNMQKNKIGKKDIIKILKEADFSIDDIIINEKETQLDQLPKVIKLIFDDLKNEKEIEKIEDKIWKIDLNFVHTFKTKKYELEYRDESAGTKRYYQIAGIMALMIKNENIFLLDELEASLHPDLYKHFILTFLVNSKNSQLIATTHNRDFLNEKDMIYFPTIWFTEKKENFATDLYSLKEFSSRFVRKTKSLYNLYKIGKLGAIPYLGDYDLELNDDE
jgi:AAA15 family ATPase/GTPase